MATLNYAFKELTCKIVYYGCGLCGKTTNLIHIHKTVPQKFRGELVSLATEQDRTLFFDFLPLDLGEVKGFKTKFQLYTVPGQVYYNATRKLVLRGVDGLVFVVDSQKDRLQENIDSLENLKQNLAEYGYHLQAGADDSEGIPWVLQYNKRDMPQVATTEELNAALNTYGVPVYDSVAVNGGGVKDTLKGISSLVIRKLNSDTGATAPTSGAAAGGTKPAAAAPQEAPKEAPAAVQAPAPQKAAAAPPQPQQPAAPPPAPPKEQAPAREEQPAAPAAPAFQVTAQGKARLRGLALGSSSLTLSSVDGNPGEFQLTGKIAFLGFLGGAVDRKLQKIGQESNSEGNFTKYITSDGNKPQYELYIKEDGSQDLYLNYIGSFGQVQIAPAGKAPLS